MPGKEIKGRSKIANYRHGGRTGKQFGGPLTQPLVRPGVGQPGVGQPGVGQPGVGQPGVMPTRPLGLKDGGRIGFKEGMGAAKRRSKKGPKKAEPKGREPKSSSTKPWKPLSIRQAVKDVVAEGGSPKLTTDEARLDRIDKKLRVIPAEKYKKGGRIGFKKGTNKKNGPVRPIDLPWPTPENPVPSKKKKK